MRAIAINVAVLVSSPDLQKQVESVLAACKCRISENRLSSSQFSPALHQADVVLLEWSASAAGEGVELAKQLRLRKIRARIIVLAQQGSEDLAIEALRLGAADYLKAPFDADLLAEAIRRCTAAEPSSDSPDLETPIIGGSAAMKAIKAQILNVAATGSSVLITGETGTGKELVAEHIHRCSSRRKKPFVCLNCAAIPDTLLESELFGYERGAFTGAVTAHAGKLAQADGGTVFFDEIGDMSLFAQAKILRAIDSKEIYPLGGRRGTRLDIRIIAATNTDLETMMKENRFRSDLYFRLNVVRMKLPPLRERPSDIPLLIQNLLPHYNRTFGYEVEGFEPETLQLLMNYSWPGNVRELKNAIEIIFLSLTPGAISVTKLPEQILGLFQDADGMHQDERERLLSTLLSTHWNVSEAARKLRWSRMTMYRRLAKYRILPKRAGTAEIAKHYTHNG